MRERPELKTRSDLVGYFVWRVAVIAKKYGLRLQGWEDGFLDGESPLPVTSSCPVAADDQPFPLANLESVRPVVNGWKNPWLGKHAKDPIVLANAGYEVGVVAAQR